MGNMVRVRVSAPLTDPRQCDCGADGVDPCSRSRPSGYDAVLRPISAVRVCRHPDPAPPPLPPEVWG